MSVISRYHFVDVKCSANKRYGSQKVIMNVTRPQKIPLYHAVLRDSGAKQINERGSAELKYDKRMTVHFDGEKGCWDFCRSATRVR